MTGSTGNVERMGEKPHTLVLDRLMSSFHLVTVSGTEIFQHRDEDVYLGF